MTRSPQRRIEPRATEFTHRRRNQLRRAHCKRGRLTRAADLMGNVATTTRFPGSDATRAAQACVIAMFRQLSGARAPVTEASAYLSLVYGGAGKSAKRQNAV
jgi:hypothetical protein